MTVRTTPGKHRSNDVSVGQRKIRFLHTDDVDEGLAQLSSFERRKVEAAIQKLYIEHQGASVICQPNNLLERSGTRHGYKITFLLNADIFRVTSFQHNPDGPSDDDSDGRFIYFKDGKQYAFRLAGKAMNGPLCHLHRVLSVERADKAMRVDAERLRRTRTIQQLIRKSTPRRLSLLARVASVLRFGFVRISGPDIAVGLRHGPDSYVNVRDAGIAFMDSWMAEQDALLRIATRKEFRMGAGADLPVRFTALIRSDYVKGRSDKCAHVSRDVLDTQGVKDACGDWEQGNIPLGSTPSMGVLLSEQKNNPGKGIVLNGRDKVGIQSQTKGTDRDGARNMVNKLSIYQMECPDLKNPKLKRSSLDFADESHGFESFMFEKAYRTKAHSMDSGGCEISKRLQ